MVWILISIYYPRFSSDTPIELQVTETPTFNFTVPTLLAAETASVPEKATETLESFTGLQATPIPTSATATVHQSVEVTTENTNKGTILTVTGGLENYDYRLGPLAKGVYAIGPNQKFLVYLTNNGIIYVHRFGNFGFQEVENANREFMALNKHVEPRFKLSFHDTGYVFILFIHEGRFGEDRQVILPRTMTYY